MQDLLFPMTALLYLWRGRSIVTAPWRARRYPAPPRSHEPLQAYFQFDVRVRTLPSSPVVPKPRHVRVSLSPRRLKPSKPLNKPPKPLELPKYRYVRGPAVAVARVTEEDPLGPSTVSYPGLGDRYVPSLRDALQEAWWRLLTEEHREVIDLSGLSRKRAGAK